MANPKIEESIALVQRAGSKLEEVRSSLAALCEYARELTAESKRLKFEQDKRQAGLTNRRLFLGQARREYEALNEQYHELLSDKPDDDDDDSAYERQLEQLRSMMAAKEQQMAKYEREIQELEQQIQELEGQRQVIAGQLEENQAKINDFHQKCEQAGSILGHNAAEMRGLSSNMESQARGFQQVGRYRFGDSEAWKNAGFRSKEASQANQVANQLDKLARQFRELARSGDNVREIER